MLENGACVVCLYALQFKITTSWKLYVACIIHKYIHILQVCVFYVIELELNVFAKVCVCMFCCALILSIYAILYWKCNFPMNPHVRWSVCWSIRLSKLPWKTEKLHFQRSSERFSYLKKQKLYDASFLNSKNFFSINIFLFLCYKDKCYYKQHT